MPGDNAKVLNHSVVTNTLERAFASFSARSIRVGEEITCNYGVFCLDWESAVNNNARVDTTSMIAKLPHQNSYARLQCGAHGVGVYAIIVIPGGVRLFDDDDAGETLRVPIDLVDALPEPALRRMYYDVCPLIEGHFVAPSHFDRLTTRWYTNLSETPNVHVDPALHFTSARPIAAGEELTTNYASYSEHAQRFLREWR